MIVSVSLKSLVRRRARTALALLGIAVSAALLIDMSMLATGLTRSVGELTGAQGYPMRVTPLGTLPFDSEAGIAEAGAVQARMEAIEGVQSVAPVLGAQLYLASGSTSGATSPGGNATPGAAVTPEGESGEPLFTAGIDPDAQMLYVLLEGRDPGEGEIVVSRPLAEALGVAPGAKLELGASLDPVLGRPLTALPFTVSGVGDFLYDFAGQRSLAMEIGAVQTMTDRLDEVSLFAVAVDPGADEEAVAQRIAARERNLSVHSTRDIMAAMDRRLAYFRQLSVILGSIALAVASLLVGTIITIGVRERYGEIATLRAIGVAASRLQLGIVAEGAALTCVGCVLGVPFGVWMAGRLDRILLGFPGIPARVSFFVFDPVPIGVALATVIAIGALAGIVPGARAMRTPLGLALREEAD